MQKQDRTHTHRPLRVRKEKWCGLLVGTAGGGWGAGRSELLESEQESMVNKDLLLRFVMEI